MDSDDATPPPDGPASDATFPVVGIGASAGGLDALQQLFGALPAETRMGFVIVQHLSPDRESALVEILARTTAMPVCEVREEMAVEPNRVHVIPPGSDLIVEGGKLRLLPRGGPGTQHGIDRFFQSLAADRGHLAIGVVLSGSASDGTLGLEEIKAAGGVTFAQDESAQHDSMPRSAVASGCVDFVLTPEAIAHELARIAQHPYVEPEAGPVEGGTATQRRILEGVRRASGVDFSQYKATTMYRRITRRMMLQRLETPREYEEYLRGTPGEIDALHRDLLIGVTGFFRDSEGFAALGREVFRKLIEACPPGETVRLWSAGCAGGEEAYSLAMTFAECAEALGSAARLQLFATDVNAEAIEKARAGLYPRSISQAVSPERLERFFFVEAGGYRVRKGLREMCVFSRHNLLADPPFSRVDVISCRNLLIYLEPSVQQRIVRHFHFALKSGGALWLGSSESVGAARKLFETADARHKIFVRRPGGRQPEVRAQAPAVTRFSPAPSGPRTPALGGLHRDAERLLLAKYAPPGVVVSPDLEIVQFQGDTGPYLAPAAGAASMDLLKMLREGLATGVREAIGRAEKEGAAVRAGGMRVRSNGGFRELAVEIIPIQPGAGRGGGFIVLFDEKQKHADAAGSGAGLGAWWRRIFPAGRPAPTDERDMEILHLKRELAATRDALQSAREEHEAASEELQSANEEAQSGNEELQSINEELESSKEEIQASNAELATINDELQARNAELTRLNVEVRRARDYARDIAASVRVPLLVLDAALRVRNASDAFCECFQVTAGETEGRRIYELGNGQWNIPPLRALLEEVLPAETAFDDFEVRHTFEQIGPRIMRLHARRLQQPEGIELLIVLTIEDITATKLTEEALRESEFLFNTLITQAPGAVFALDADVRFHQLNPKALAVFGHLGPLIGRPFAEVMEKLWGGEIAAQIMEIFRHTLATGERYVSPDFYHHRADTGVHESYEWEIQRIPLPGGRQGVVCYFTEVTQRRRDAETLRVSEERFRSLVSVITDVPWTTDPIGAFVEPQMAWTAYTGQSWEEHRGLGWVEALHPEDRPGLLETWNRAVESRSLYTTRCRIWHAPSQGWRRSMARGTPLFAADGSIREWVGTCTDREDEERATEDLRASEARKDAILTSALDAIITMDHEGRLVEFNPAAERIFGHVRSGVLGRLLADVIIPERMRERHNQGLKHYLATGDGPVLNRLIELPALRADGTEFPAELAIVAIPGVQPAVFTAFLRDVTGRKQLEHSLLARAEQLARADRSKDEFLAMLAHELRNPLAPLRNATEILKTDDASAEERSQAKRIIGGQIENMSRMLDDLLDVSRITEGKISLRKKPVALEAVLTAAASIARSACAANDQKLTVALPAEPVWLEADATRLEQVFGNLLGNACKYSGDGSHIWLSAEMAAAESSSSASREVIVRVRDDGAGIDPEVLPHIFDLFVQATRSLDRAHGGLGIGLTLVQRLVKLHGGTIEAHSEGPGSGAEFIVRLPVLAEAPPPASPPPTIVGETSHRILIVDDNTDSARSMAVLQRRRGHETHTAFTGPDALTAAAAFKPSVVLLDIGLPGMDGFEVALQFRADPSLRGVLLIAMSGYGSEEDRAHAKRAGFDAYLVKPIDLDQLRDLLRERK